MRMEEEIRVENFQSMQEEEIAADKRRHEEQMMRLQQLEQESSGTHRQGATLDRAPGAPTAPPAVGKADARGEECGVFAEAMSAAGTALEPP